MQPTIINKSSFLPLTLTIFCVLLLSSSVLSLKNQKTQKHAQSEWRHHRQQTARVTFSGKILTPDREPVAFADVVVAIDTMGIKFNGRSDANGQFEVFSDLPMSHVISGTATVNSPRGDFLASTFPVFFFAGNGYHFTMNEIILEYFLIYSRLSGKIIRKDSKEPVKGAFINVDFDETLKMKSHESISDISGNFAIAEQIRGNLLSLSMKLTVSDKNFNSFTKTFNLLKENEFRLEDVVIELEPLKTSGNVRGQVQDMLGAQIANASVNITIGDKLFTTTTDASGRFSSSVPDLARGLIHEGVVSVTADGKEVTTVPFTIQESFLYSTQVIVTLRERLTQGFVTGTVTDKEGKPLKNVLVEIFFDGKRKASQQSDEKGEFNIKVTVVDVKLVEGKLRATLEDFVAAEGTFLLKSDFNFNTMVSVKLFRQMVEGLITGTLMLDSGEPLASGKVSFQHASNQNIAGEVLSDNMGRFTLKVPLLEKGLSHGIIINVRELEHIDPVELRVSLTPASNYTYSYEKAILISRQKALARISGRVVSEDGKPVEGVELGFWQADSRTHVTTVNNAGEFTFEFEVSKGLVYKGEVRIQLEGFSKGVKEIFLDANNNYTFSSGDIVLKFLRQVITVKGTLKDLNGLPISNLYLSFRSNELEVSGKSDASGNFLLSLSPKESEVHIGNLVIEDKDDNDYLREAINCVFHRDNAYTFVVDKTIYRRFLDVAVHGVVVDDRTKAPASNVTVQLQVKNSVNINEAVASTTTDEQGRYSLEIKHLPGMVSIVAEVRASSENYLERTQSVEFSRENKYVLRNVDFSLVKERLVGRISLRLVDEHAQAIVGASAKVTILTPVTQSQNQDSDGNGKVSLSLVSLEKGLEYSGVLEVVMKHKLSRNITVIVSKANNYVLELGDVVLTHVRVQASISGRVVDSKSRGLSGVLVLMSDTPSINTTTSNEGLFTLKESDLLEGKQYIRTIRLHLPNFQPELIKATVDLSNSYNLYLGDSTLKREIVKGTITGEVVNERGERVAGVSVVLTLPLGTKLAETQTNETGAFSIVAPNLERGLDYQGEVEVKAPGKVSVKKIVSLALNNAYTEKVGVVKLAFVRVEGHVNGIIQDSRGKLLANASISALSKGLELLKATSDSQGAFEMKGTLIQEETYDLNIVFTLEDYESINVTAQLSQQNLHRAKLGVINMNKLVQRVVLSGSVANEVNKPLSDIVITMSVLEDPTVYSVRTDEAGNFRLDKKVKSKEIIGATVKIRDVDDWYDFAQREVGFHDGNQYTVQLPKIVLVEKYVRELSVQGVVRDAATNAPLENANVTLAFDASFEQKRFSYLTMERGAFSFVFSKVFKKTEFKADLSVSHPNYQVQSTKIALNKDNLFQSEVVLSLTRKTIAFEHRGIVEDEGNQPLANATVTLIIHGFQPQESSTNESGEYSFRVPDLLIGENYFGKLTVTHPFCEIPSNLPRLYANVSNNYSSSLASPIQLVYKKTSGKIYGQVVGFQRKPLSQSTVELRGDKGQSIQSVKTDLLGQFSFEQQIVAFPSVGFRVRVVADEYKLFEREVVLRDKTNWELDMGMLMLNPLKTIVEISIEALLVDELTKAPVAGADYEILLPASYQALTGRTNEDGKIVAKSVLKDMTVIPIELLVTHNNGKYLPVKRKIELNDANSYSSRIDRIELFHVTRELTVEGVLRREVTNEIISNAVVVVERQGYKTVELFTDSQGRFIFYDPSVISQITHTVSLTFTKSFYFNRTQSFNLSRTLNQFSIKNLTVFLKVETVTVSVRGRLLDEEQGLRPLLGGNVTLRLKGEAKTFITSSLGVFNIEFPNLEKGKDYHLKLRVSSKDKNTVKRNLTASLSENNYQIDLGNVTITHELVEGTIAGKIIGSDSDSAIEGVQIVNELNKVLLPNQTTNAQGQFKLALKVKKGQENSVFLRFFKPHYLLLTKIVLLSESESYSKYLDELVLERIQRSGMIGGKILDERKIAINGSLVTLVLGSTTKTEVTDNNGDFKVDFNGLYEGPDYPVSLSISKEHYIPYSQSLSLSLNSSYNVDLKEPIILKRERVPGQIRGRVIDQLKNPVGGVKASVDTDYAGENKRTTEILTDANGIFLLEVEALKNLELFMNLKLSAAGYPEKTLPVLLSPENQYRKDVGDIEYSSLNITLSYIARVLSYSTRRPIANLDFVFKPVHGDALFERSNEVGLINLTRNVPRRLDYSGLIRVFDSSRVVATFERSVSFNLTNNFSVVEGEILLEPETVLLDISGKVRRNDSNEGVEGATVGILLEENLETVSRFNVLTDKNGAFLLQTPLKSGKNYEVKIFSEKKFYDSSAPTSRLINKTNNYTAKGISISLTRKKTDGLISLSVEEENGLLSTPAELTVIFNSGETIIAKSDALGLIKVPIKGLDFGEVYQGSGSIIHPFKHPYVLSVVLHENNSYSFVLKDKIVLRRVRVNGVISGYIRDKYRGEAVSGAFLEIISDLGSFNASSSSSGNFSAVIPKIDQELRVQGVIKIRQPFFEPIQLVFNLVPENNHTIFLDSLFMQHLKRAANLTGTIVDQLMRPVKDAKLDFQINGFSALEETGADGSFLSTPVLNNGVNYESKLIITKENYEKKEISFALLYSSNFTYNFGVVTLSKSIKWQEILCKGRLTDPLGNPLAGLNITLGIPNDRGVHSVATDEAGNFLIRANAEYQPVINGQVNITDNNGNYRRSDRKVAFYEGNLFTWDLNTITLILDKVPVSITGSVVDAETAKPLQGISVQVQFTRENGSVFSAAPRTSAEGVFFANSTTAGHLEFTGSLNLAPEFYEPLNFPFSLLLSEKFQKNLIIKVQREKVNFTVEGHVVGENQEGLSRVDVTLSLDSDPSRHVKGTTQKNGHFKLVLHNLNKGEVYNATVRFRKDHHKDEYRKVSGSVINNYTVILKESFSLQQLDTAGSVAIRVRNESNVSMANISVEIFQDGALVQTNKTEPSGDQLFLLDLKQGVDYGMLLRISERNYELLTVKFNLNMTNNYTASFLDLLLKRIKVALSVSGNLRGEDGRIPQPTLVELNVQGQAPIKGTLDDKGHFAASHAGLNKGDIYVGNLTLSAQYRETIDIPFVASEENGYNVEVLTPVSLRFKRINATVDGYILSNTAGVVANADIELNITGNIGANALSAYGVDLGGFVTKFSVKTDSNGYFKISQIVNDGASYVTSFFVSHENYEPAKRAFSLNPLNNFSRTISDVTLKRKFVVLTARGLVFGEEETSLKNVNVTLTLNNLSNNTFTEITDKSGRFSILVPEKPKGYNYEGRLHISLVNRDNVSIPISFGPQNGYSFELKERVLLNFTRARSNVFGRVLAENGSAIENAEIEVYRENEKIYSLITGPSGSFNFTKTLNASLLYRELIRVRAIFYAPVEQNYTLQQSNNYTANLTLSLVLNRISGTIKGRTVDKDLLRPVSGVLVSLQLFGSDGFNFSTNSTETSGGQFFITIPALRETITYNGYLLFTSASTNPHRQDITLSYDNTYMSDLGVVQLARKDVLTVIKGVVTDGESKPLRGITVTLLENFDIKGELLTDMNGSYVFSFMRRAQVYEGEVILNGKYINDKRMSYSLSETTNFTAVVNFQNVEYKFSTMSVICKGKLIDEKGSPVVDREVILTLPSSQDVFIFRTLSNGDFNFHQRIPASPVASGVVSVEDPDEFFVPISEKVAFYEGNLFEYDLGIITLREKLIEIVYSGLLFEKNTQIPAPPGVNLTLVIKNQTANFSAVTDADGKFVLQTGEKIFSGYNYTGNISIYGNFIVPLTLENIRFTRFNKYRIDLEKIAVEVRRTDLEVQGRLLDERGEPLTGRLLSANIMGIGLRASSNVNGEFLIKVPGKLRGFEYTGVITYFEAHREELNVSYFGSESTGYSLNLGNVTLSRKVVDVTISTVFKENRTKELLEGVVAHVITTAFEEKKSPKVVFDDKLVTDKSGLLQVRLEGKSGLRYETNISVSRQFFQNKSLTWIKQDSNNYSIHVNETLLERNIITGSLSGSISEGSFNQPLSGAAVDILVLSPIPSNISNISASSNGTFASNITLQEGLNYSVEVIVNRANYNPLSTRNLSLSGSNNYTLDLPNLVMENFKRNFTVTGRFKDLDTKELINNVSYSFELFSALGSAVLTGNSDQNGSFSITGDVLEPLEYNFTLRGIKPFYHQKARRGYLNLSNQYSSDQGLIRLDRLEGNFELYGSLHDSLLNTSVAGAAIKALLVSKRGSIELSTRSKHDGTYLIASELEHNINYTLNINVTADHFVSNQTSVNIFFNESLSINHTLALNRRAVPFHVKGKLFDNVSLIRINDSSLLLSIESPVRIPVLTLRSSESGFFHFKGELPEGVNFTATLNGSSVHHLLDSRPLNLNLTNNYTKNLGVLNMYRKSVQAVVRGSIADAQTTKALNFSTVQISLKPAGNLTHLPEVNLSTLNNSVAEFVLQGTVQSGVDYVVDTRVSRTYYNSIHSNSSQVTFSNNYTADLGVISLDKTPKLLIIEGTNLTDADLGNPLDGAVVLLNVLKNGTYEQYKVRSKAGNFTAVTEGFQGEEYSAYLQLSKHHFEPLRVENIILNEANNHTARVSGLSLNRTRYQARLSGRAEALEAGPLANVSVTADIRHNKSNHSFIMSALTDANGEYSFNFTAFSGLAYNASLNYEKQYFAPQLVSNVILENQNNFSAQIKNLTFARQSAIIKITGSLFDKDTQERLENAEVLVRIKKNNSLEVIRVHSKNGTFSAVAGAESGLNYFAVIMIGLPHYRNLMLENLNFTEDNNHTVLLSNLTLSRIQVKPRLSGKLSEADGSSLLNATVGLQVSSIHTNISLTQTAWSNENGVYSFEFDGYSGFDYNISLNYSKQYYIPVLFRSHSLTNDNNFTLNSIDLTLHRHPVNLTVSLSLFDPTTNKWVQNASAVLHVSKNNKLHEIAIESDANGRLAFLTGGFSGLSYAASVNVSKPNFHAIALSNLTLAEENNHTLNLSTLNLSRIQVEALISGQVSDDKGQSMSNVSVDFHVTNNETNSTLNLSALTDEQGSYQFNFSGYSGFLYNPQLLFSKQYYDSLRVLNKTLENGNNFKLSGVNINLNRTVVPLNVSGYLFDLVTGKPIKDAEIIMRVSRNGNYGDVVANSRKNGAFSVIFFGYAGFTYNASLSVAKANYHSIALKTWS